ncbi:hypothetical protein ACIHCQ_03260 [Streptomyces sp. NPDC052236]|uniref:hypothetical protein n=1 Tax=Streptomyces sp. NPDC052236 TaxID=3365686 RepID=UPI0037D18D41
MATFDVQLTASKDPRKCYATAVGEEIHTITDQEKKAFGFDDWGRIQRACGSIIGESPDQWFLHNPTKPHPNPGDHSYDSAYDVFDWQPVTVSLYPTQAEFVGVNTKPVIAYDVEWDNEADHTVTFNADMATQKTESVSHSVSTSTTIGAGTTLSFGVGIKEVGDVSRELNFSFTKEWGETTTNTQDITVGTSAGAYDDVPAHSKDTAYLWSNLGTAQFRVTYQATLSGSLMTLNNDWYGGHCYRGMDASYVLGKAGLSRSVTIQYDHTVGFYSDAQVDIAPGPYDPNHKPPSGLLSRSMIFAPPSSRGSR